MAHSNKGKPPAGRFSYEGLDRVIHERARLSILTSLIANRRGLLFSDLKQLCALSDGNLSRHLQVLQEAKLIAVSKGFEKNRPQTVCRITALTHAIPGICRGPRAGGARRGGGNERAAARRCAATGAGLIFFWLDTL